MQIPRIYQPEISSEFYLTADAAHRVLHVLRKKLNDPIKIFDGKGKLYSAEISQIKKRQVLVTLKEKLLIDKESPLKIHLVQAITRQEKMDFILQKATELGVTKITPIITEYGSVKLTKTQEQKKYQHWQKILIHACEQSERNLLPELIPVISWQNWLTQIKLQQNEKILLLHPHSKNNINLIKENKFEYVTLVIGAEGGFSEHEIHQAEKKQIQFLQLGKRILRMETAAIVAMGILQALWGDLLCS